MAALLQKVHFLLFTLSFELATASIVNGKAYAKLDGFNATISNPVQVLPGKRALMCAASCSRNANCEIFTVETGGGAGNPTCRLGGSSPTISAAPAGITSSLYYESSLIPGDYFFAILLNGRLNFLKTAPYINYTAATAACESDGRGRLVLDDLGQAWHNFLINVPYVVGRDFWIGADDMDENGVYTWIDGRLVSSSTTFWDVGQPDFHNYGNESERCVCTRSTTRLWNDVTCSNSRRTLCEIRLP